MVHRCKDMGQIRRDNITNFVTFSQFSQLYRAEILTRLLLCRAKAKLADIAAAVQSTNTESSSSLRLLAFLSPSDFRHSRISNELPLESPHNAVSSAACRHHRYCNTVPSLRVIADSYADWDNIGFKVREGMFQHTVATYTPSLRSAQSTAISNLTTALRPANGANLTSSRIPTSAYTACHLP